MTDLRDLYQEVILDHGRNPRNFRKLEAPCLQSHGHNPLCGDRITVYARLQGERIEELSFEGSGCAICMASASLMTERLRGATLEEAERTFAAVRSLVTGESNDETPSGLLGKLSVLAGVSRYPVRVKCAILPWHTLRSTVAGREATVSTE
jgi:nitrogen fixation NifU-like protein